MSLSPKTVWTIDLSVQKGADLMNVSSAVSRACAVYPELAGDSRIYSWLSEIEERIVTGLIGGDFSGITSSENQRELSAPEFLSEVYPLYLIMKCDLANSDHSRYLCHNAAFSSTYAELANYFTRTSVPGDQNYYKFL